MTYSLAEVVEHVYMYTSSAERPRLDFPPDNEKLNKSMLGETRKENNTDQGGIRSSHNQAFTILRWVTKWHDTYGKCFSLNLSSVSTIDAI